MRLLASAAVGITAVAATLSLAAAAHAGGPPNDGGGVAGGAGTAAPSRCSDADFTVTSGPLEYADTLRRVVVSFKNTSSRECTLVGYPDANLLTASGVLVHIDRQPALAAHLLHLAPGDVATAFVEAHAIDANANSCPSDGTLVVTTPGESVAHTLPVTLPTCNATISSVD
jgi:hypothetical protein